MGTVHDVSVKMGRVVEVFNTQSHPAANKSYLQIKCEDYTGKSEIYVMFTKKELDKCPIVDTKLDLITGRCYDYVTFRFDGYIVKLEEYNESMKRWFIVTRLITKRRLEHARLRKERNLEDVVPTSLYQDLID